jgi:hypothetical protein
MITVTKTCEWPARISLTSSSAMYIDMYRHWSVSTWQMQPVCITFLLSLCQLSTYVLTMTYEYCWGTVYQRCFHWAWPKNDDEPEWWTNRNIVHLKMLCSVCLCHWIWICYAFIVSTQCCLSLLYDRSHRNRSYWHTLGYLSWIIVHKSSLYNRTLSSSIAVDKAVDQWFRLIRAALVFASGIDLLPLFNGKDEAIRCIFSSKSWIVIHYPTVCFFIFSCRWTMNHHCMFVSQENRRFMSLVVRKETIKALCKNVIVEREKKIF